MQERHPLQIKNGGRVWVEREVWRCIANWRLLALDNIGFKPNARQKLKADSSQKKVEFMTLTCTHWKRFCGCNCLNWVPSSCMTLTSQFARKLFDNCIKHIVYEFVPTFHIFCWWYLLFLFLFVFFFRVRLSDSSITFINESFKNFNTIFMKNIKNYHFFYFTFP